MGFLTTLNVGVGNLYSQIRVRLMIISKLPDGILSSVTKGDATGFGDGKGYTPPFDRLKLCGSSKGLLYTCLRFHPYSNPAFLHGYGEREDRREPLITAIKNGTRVALCTDERGYLPCLRKDAKTDTSRMHFL